MLAVTHDRYFLDNVAEWICEVDRGHLYPYKGNYSTYLETKAARIEAQGNRDAKLAKRMEAELEWVRSSPKARQAKNKARLARYEEMEAEARASQKLDWTDIRIPVGPRLGNKVLEAHHLHKEFDGRVLIDDLSFTLPRNGIVGVIGPNGVGKTTLFNQLTGSNQHVGNFPGVTVDRKDGTIRNHPEASVTDLPGIYSLSPYTGEEIVSRQFILDENPDAIIDIIDATNIERNLYLTLQLMELDRPMVIALNMMDEVTANGGAVDVNLLESLLGVPVVPISAARNEGIGELGGFMPCTWRGSASAPVAWTSVRPMDRTAAHCIAASTALPT